MGEVGTDCFLELGLGGREFFWGSGIFGRFCEGQKQVLFAPDFRFKADYIYSILNYCQSFKFFFVILLSLNSTF